PGQTAGPTDGGDSTDEAPFDQIAPPAAGASATGGGATGAGAAGDATSTTAAPDATPNPDAVNELPADFDQTPATTPSSPAPSPADEAPMDLGAPPLSQAGHTTGHHDDKAALWATGLSFAAVLLVLGGWLWIKRRKYDPA
ncbi:MAG TPA: hypothetical protein VHL53_01545, partial [Acidimicrobiia bacterium]|nr:hypothetical protein [Acidimicrobiia bacterium]